MTDFKQLLQQFLKVSRISYIVFLITGLILSYLIFRAELNSNLKYLEKRSNFIDYHLKMKLSELKTIWKQFSTISKFSYEQLIEHEEVVYLSGTINGKNYLKNEISQAEVDSIFSMKSEKRTPSFLNSYLAMEFDVEGLNYRCVLNVPTTFDVSEQLIFEEVNYIGLIKDSKLLKNFLSTDSLKNASIEKLINENCLIIPSGRKNFRRGFFDGENISWFSFNVAGTDYKLVIYHYNNNFYLHNIYYCNDK